MSVFVFTREGFIQISCKKAEPTRDTRLESAMTYGTLRRPEIVVNWLKRSIPTNIALVVFTKLPIADVKSIIHAEVLESKIFNVKVPFSVHYDERRQN